MKGVHVWVDGVGSRKDLSLILPVAGVSRTRVHENGGAHIARVIAQFHEVGFFFQFKEILMLAAVKRFRRVERWRGGRRTPGCSVTSGTTAGPSRKEGRFMRNSCMLE